MTGYTSVAQRMREERAAKQARQLGEALNAPAEAVAVLERRLAAKSHLSDPPGYLAKIVAFHERGEFTTTTNVPRQEDDDAHR